MNLVRTIAETRTALAELRTGGRIVGLVPTMGALHEGHGALMDRARRECGVVAVSIFVNPHRLFVVDDHNHTLEEIPLVRVRELSVSRRISAQDEPDAEPQTWELEITWESKEMRTARFRFDGVFAEHLARVAENTVRNLLRKDLPVLGD